MKTYFIALTLLASFFVANITSAESNEKLVVVQNLETSYQVGDIKVTLLSEGNTEREVSFLANASPADLQKYLPRGVYKAATNAFLVQTPEKTVLIDTGFGRASFYSYLDNTGVKPADIDLIFITHMHRDHIFGLLKADGTLAYPNATIYVNKKELDYWQGKEEGNVLAKYGSRVQTFVPNELDAIASPLIDGVYPIAAYGHTPGHTLFMIQDGSHRLLIVGDLINAAEIQLPLPSVTSTYDVDSAQAAETRKEVFAYVSANNIPVAGAHIPLPGMGKIEKEENAEGYRIVPLLK